ncbi:MAG: 50S ribosomal protein L15 [Candidatus Nealsonbacteria bacterium]|nr:50S ribosomal protein L15 [Candidatus Nealsonbacteria bacterium]
MQLHELKPYHKRKSRKRVGRGGKRGTYSGKGVKGQNSRSGRKFPPAIRELIKRYPKLRGYRFKTQDSNIEVINLDVLDKNFEAGQTVNPQALSEKKLIRNVKGKMPKVKILGGGKITKSLTFENCLVSKQAKEKIEKANGLVK